MSGLRGDPGMDRSTQKMVKAFGGKGFDVIEAEPDQLRKVTGMGVVRAKRITDAWAEQKIVLEIMVFLHSNGVGTARAVRSSRYGADAVQVVREPLSACPGYSRHRLRTLTRSQCGSASKRPP